jgi:FixJ family two-component response regulator
MPAPKLAPEAPIIHLVEDDESSGAATSRVLRAAGLDVRLYRSAPEFLASLPSGPGCLVLDLSLPGPSGLELQERLATLDDALPIVFVTGHGDVPKTAQAMKAGAIDFLTKPVDAEALLDAVRRALAPREREVLAHVISGQLNKQIAFDLGTSEHTIKVHRQRVMEKLEAASVPDLVRLAEDLGIPPVGRVI